MLRKKMMLFFLSFIAITTTCFGENFVLDNQTAYPNKNQNSKIAIQWAKSAKEVNDGNNTLMHESKVESDTLLVLDKTGKINIEIPQNAEYFRILVWSKAEEDPDLVTNWVDIVPNKTYTVKTDHLVPIVLMVGMGC